MKGALSSKLAPVSSKLAPVSSKLALASSRTAEVPGNSVWQGKPAAETVVVLNKWMVVVVNKWMVVAPC